MRDAHFDLFRNNRTVDEYVAAFQQIRIAGHNKAEHIRIQPWIVEAFELLATEAEGVGYSGTIGNQALMLVLGGQDDERQFKLVVEERVASEDAVASLLRGIASHEAAASGQVESPAHIEHPVYHTLGWSRQISRLKAVVRNTALPNPVALKDTSSSERVLRETMRTLFRKMMLHLAGASIFDRKMVMAESLAQDGTRVVGHIQRNFKALQEKDTIARYSDCVFRLLLFAVRLVCWKQKVSSPLDDGHLEASSMGQAAQALKISISPGLTSAVMALIDELPGGRGSAVGGTPSSPAYRLQGEEEYEIPDLSGGVAPGTGYTEQDVAQAAEVYGPLFEDLPDIDDAGDDADVDETGADDVDDAGIMTIAQAMEARAAAGLAPLDLLSGDIQQDAADDDVVVGSQPVMGWVPGDTAATSGVQYAAVHTTASALESAILAVLEQLWFSTPATAGITGTSRCPAHAFLILSLISPRPPGGKIKTKGARLYMTGFPVAEVNALQHTAKLLHPRSLPQMLANCRYAMRMVAYTLAARATAAEGNPSVST